MNEDGLTPLLLAASKGHKEIVEMLVAAKANTQATSVHGETAQVLAATADIARMLASVHGMVGGMSLVLRVLCG